MELFVAALSLGFLGSFHCVGMCGPIAMALPLGGYKTAEKIWGALLYNLGRATTYGIFGWLVGWVGSAMQWTGWQQYFSVSLGVIILLYIIIPEKLKAKVEAIAFFHPAFSLVKEMLTILFRQKSFSSLYFIGALNGFLPCGLVYAALAGALATGNPIEGGAFMILFGLGTFPLMTLVNLSGSLINVRWRNRIRKAVPVLVSAMAVLLIVRGLNLGIPYVSPKVVDLPSGSAVVCH
jgi:sulfite exporter TauE/SafE